MEANRHFQHAEEVKSHEVGASTCAKNTIAWSPRTLRALPQNFAALPKQRFVGIR
jgi:hypothetical protein